MYIVNTFTNIVVHLDKVLYIIGFSGRYLTRIDSIQLLSTLERFATDDLDEDDDADENGM